MPATCADSLKHIIHSENRMWNLPRKKINQWSFPSFLTYLQFQFYLWMSCKFGNLNFWGSNEVLGMKIPNSLLENMNHAVLNRINKEIGIYIPQVLKLSICLLGYSIECFIISINITSTFRNNNILKSWYFSENEINPLLPIFKRHDSFIH